jgi:hypothetical protein
MLLSRKLNTNSSLSQAVKYEVGRVPAPSWKSNNKFLGSSDQGTVVQETVNIPIPLTGLYCVVK